jgi:hypothetical protein
MNNILNNPYRILGLLIGASATQLNRHRIRIPNYILVGSHIPTEFTDFSFDLLGTIDRTEENISYAASKLNLNSDRMSAALFWFYNGNPISDEPAFDAIKEANIDQAINIWTKLIESGDVSRRNASAYSNLGTLYLRSIFDVTNTNEAILEQGVSLKLKFLESDFIKDFIALAADESYKTTKKELQLLFLNQVLSEIEKSGTLTSNKFLDILTKQEFLAKDDFIKGFVQKSIEVIQSKIQETKLKRKANEANLVHIGNALYEHTKESLSQLKSILGESNIKYESIADKLANEILQCSIDYFKNFQETNSNIDYAESAYILAKSTKSIAIGRLTIDRIIDCLNTLEKQTYKSILSGLKFLQSIKDTYEKNWSDIEKQFRYKVNNQNNIAVYSEFIISTNQKNIKDRINSSIDWIRVNQIATACFSDINLKKIKKSDNPEIKIKFLELVNWLKTHSLERAPILNILINYTKIPIKLPFEILESSIKNTNNKPLYTEFIRFISLHLNIRVIEEQEITFFVRFVNPDGSIKCNLSTSPPDYTYAVTKLLNSDTTMINLAGWGNSEKCIYDVGTNLIEIYYKDTLIDTLSFVVEISPMEKLEIELQKAREKERDELKIAHVKLTHELKSAYKQLKEIKNKKYFLSELSIAENELAEINEWRFLRRSAVKRFQIEQQQEKINRIIIMANDQMKFQVEKQLVRINEIEDQIQKLIVKIM